MCEQKVWVFKKAEVISEFAYVITPRDFSDMK